MFYEIEGAKCYFLFNILNFSRSVCLYVDVFLYWRFSFVLVSFTSIQSQVEYVIVFISIP